MLAEQGEKLEFSSTGRKGATAEYCVCVWGGGGLLTIPTIIRWLTLVIYAKHIHCYIHKGKAGDRLGVIRPTTAGYYETLHKSQRMEIGGGSS